ncbi:MAG: hypothetical protein ABH846_01730 [Patescibacteria group bacterium]
MLTKSDFCAILPDHDAFGGSLEHIEHEHEELLHDDQFSIKLELVHHRATDYSEGHEEMGWEVKALTFTLWPGEDEYSMAVRAFTNRMYVIREWLAGFSIDDILRMICAYSDTCPTASLRIPFRDAMMRIDVWLYELDKVPSWPFDDDGNRI